MVEEDPALTFSSLLEWARAKVKGQEFTLIYTGEANIRSGTDEGGIPGTSPGRAPGGGEIFYTGTRYRDLEPQRG